MATRVLRRQASDTKKRDKPTTLSPDYPCDDCGEPAMVDEGGRLRCPICWLKKQGAKISRIDSGGYYP